VIESLDALKDKADVVFFDGGSNFQLAGRIIRARFPRITVVHGLEHVLSLVFVDISKIPVIHVSYFVLFLIGCGLVFDDIDASPPVRMRVSSTKLKYIKRSGCHAMGEPPDYIGVPSTKMY
jgi:hypothetical protein